MKSKKQVFGVETSPGWSHHVRVRGLLLIGMVVLLLPVAGCVSRGPGLKMSWRTLSRGLTSGLTESGRVVIRTEAEFLKIWARHAADVNRPALPPAVDFGREMVIAVTMGNQPTGGYLTEVVDLELRGRTLRVLVGERVPQPGTMQIQRPTQPFQFVALPVMSGRVEFRTVHEAGGLGRSRKARPGEDAAKASSSAIKAPVQALESPRGAANKP